MPLRHKLGTTLQEARGTRSQAAPWWSAPRRETGPIRRRAIVPRRAEIGAFVTQVVENWDAGTLVNRMELQVGRDLQFIRINGTIVGGLVGLLLFCLTRLLA